MPMAPPRFIDADRPIFKTKDLAEALGVSTQYIRQQVKDGHLHATVRRLSHHRTVLRFSLDDVRAYDVDAACRLERDVPRGTSPI